MTDINEVVLTGNITRDIEVKQVTDKFTVGNTAVAVAKSYKVGDEWKTDTAFIDLKLRGSLATSNKDKMTKGRPVCISGKLVQEKWEKDGAKFSRVLVDVEHVLYMDRTKSGSAAADAPSETPSETPSAGGEVGADGFPEDVPF